MFGGFALAGRSGLGIFIVGVFLDVLHDQRDAAVGWIKRGGGLAQSLIGEPANLNDLIGANAIGLHNAAGGIGAIGREFPVSVSSRRGVRLRIGVAFDREFVGQAAHFLGQLDQKFGSIGLEFGAAAVKESAAGRFGELDAKAFGSDRHFDVAFELFEIRHLPHGVLQLFFELGHIVTGEDKIVTRALHVGPDFPGSSSGIFEISADRDLNLFAAIEQPQDDEQGHHGGDEIGIGNLPRAAMVSTVAALLFEDDDGARFFGDVRHISG